MKARRKARTAKIAHKAELRKLAKAKSQALLYKSEGEKDIAIYILIEGIIYIVYIYVY